MYRSFNIKSNRYITATFYILNGVFMWLFYKSKY